MGTLVFVEQRDLFSIYRNASGEPVYLAHGAAPFTRFTIAIDDLDIEEWWDDLELSREDFLAFLVATLIEPSLAAEVRWCVDCSTVTWLEDGSTVEGNEFACDSCVENCYISCARCRSLVTESTGTLNDDSICEPCLEGYYSYCEDCEGYYINDNAGEHDHDGSDRCGCESPALRFTIRNDGEPDLVNGTHATITLPAGVIDDEGLQRIRAYMHGKGLYNEAVVLDQIDNRWQTREGNFTKRFSRAVYKTLGSKTEPELLSMIGTIAGEHSRAVDFTVEVTRDLNQRASAFYHSGSCWWTDYSQSRCALKSNGGFGLLTHEDYGVTGRAWVMPLKKVPAAAPLPFTDEPTTAPYTLLPTFDTMTPAAFVVFNGYGRLEGYTAARILSHMVGMTYRRIAFDCDPMYVNSGGYLVAPEDIATRYNDGELVLSVEQHSSLFQDERALAAITIEKELFVNVA